ncbi:RNA polymerase-binding transcription factor DksA [compost metagenome]
MNAVADPRTALEALAAEYARRAESIRRDLAAAHSSSFPEQAVQRQNDDVLRALLAEAEDGLQLVAHARERLAAGRYGICAACGEPIGAARLAALPTAERCVDCAGAQED